MSYKSNESKRRFKRNIKRAKLKAIKNMDAIVIAVATTVLLGGSGGLVYRLSTEEKPNIYMGEKIEFDGEEYWKSNLYLLSKDDETHLCNLEKRTKQFYTIERKITSENFVAKPANVEVIYDPWVYVDVKTNKELSIRNYEKYFDYEVVPFEGQISFDDAEGEMVYEDRIHYKKFEMSKEQYEQLVNKDDKSKTLVYMSK